MVFEVPTRHNTKLQQLVDRINELSDELEAIDDLVMLQEWVDKNGAFLAGCPGTVADPIFNRINELREALK